MAPHHYTPLLRFLGDYLKKVEAAGMVLVPCNADKYSVFAAVVNFRPPNFTQLSETADTLLANMRTAGMLSTADAEGSDHSDDSDDDNTSAIAPRRRPSPAPSTTRATATAMTSTTHRTMRLKSPTPLTALRPRWLGSCGLGVRGARVLPAMYDTVSATLTRHPM